MPRQARRGSFSSSSLGALRVLCIQPSPSETEALQVQSFFAELAPPFVSLYWTWKRCRWSCKETIRTMSGQRKTGEEREQPNKSIAIPGRMWRQQQKWGSLLRRHVESYSSRNSRNPVRQINGRDRGDKSNAETQRGKTSSGATLCAFSSPLRVCAKPL